jgi:hypothetical protein
VACRAPGGPAIERAKAVSASRPRHSRAETHDAVTVNPTRTALIFLLFSCDVPTRKPSVPLRHRGSWSLSLLRSREIPCSFCTAPGSPPLFCSSPSFLSGGGLSLSRHSYNPVRATRDCTNWPTTSTRLLQDTINSSWCSPFYGVCKSH